MERSGRAIQVGKTPVVFISWLNGAKLGGGACALGHHLSQGLFGHIGPRGAEEGWGTPSPVCPRAGSGTCVLKGSAAPGKPQGWWKQGASMSQRG